MKTYNSRFSLMLNAVLNLGISQRALILDIGCGVGLFCEIMLNRGFHIIGLDLDKKSIKAAWSRLGRKQGFHVVLADAQHLPFRAELFDLVICTEVIEHLHKPFQSLKEIVRISQAGAFLLLSTPNAIGLFNLLFDRLAGGIRNFASRLFGRTRRYYSGHISLFTYSSLIGALQQFNLIVERDLELWRAEGLVSSYLFDSFRHHFNLNLREHIVFKIVKEMDLWVSGLFPQQLKSGWMLLCRKNTPAETLPQSE